MSAHIVTAKAVKVSIGGATGHRVAHILRAGDIVPEGVDEETVKRLAADGLISTLDPKPTK